MRRPDMGYKTGYMIGSLSGRHCAVVAVMKGNDIKTLSDAH